MIRFKKTLCLFLAVMCIVTAAGCSTAQPLETKVALTVTTQPPATETTQPDGPVSKVIFPKKLLGIAKLTPEEWVDDLIATSDGQYVDVYVNEDGISVTLEITEEQREYWKASRAGHIETLQNNFTEINPNYRIDVSEDYTHFDIYYNLDLDLYNTGYYVIYAEVFCASMQLFNGTDAEEWYVSANIYNSDTGKLVTSGDSEVGLAYEGEDWERSYSEE